MKAAIIAPPALLSVYATTDYHLTLIDQLMNDPVYYEFYEARGKAGDFIIIDNSAHEYGASKYGDHMIRLAHEINAQEIVLPERMFWGRDTIEMAGEVYDRYRTALPNVRIAGVPQGRTIEEWDWCCLEHLKMGVDTIGISKDFEVWPGGLAARVTTVRHLCRQSQRHNIDIHLLGWGRNLWELHEIAEIADHRIAAVRGVDSAKPLVYAAAGIQLPFDFWACASLPEYPRRPSDFFSFDHSRIDSFLAQNNLGSFLAQVVPGSHESTGTTTEVSDVD